MPAGADAVRLCCEARYLRWMKANSCTMLRRYAMHKNAEYPLGFVAYEARLVGAGTRGAGILRAPELQTFPQFASI